MSTSEVTITEDGLKHGSKLAPKGAILMLVRGSMLFNKVPVGMATVDVSFNQDVKSIQKRPFATNVRITNHESSI